MLQNTASIELISRRLVGLQMVVVFVFALASSVSTAQQPTEKPPLDESTTIWPKVQWNPDWIINRKRPGYPLLKDVSHVQIQPPSAEAGAYHHHPLISKVKGKLVAIWSNHPTGEDGSGQQILGASSTNGETWSEPQVIFAPVDKIRSSSLNGRSLLPGGIFESGNQLYVFCVINDSVGFGEFDSSVLGNPQSKTRTAKFPKRIRKGQGYLVRTFEFHTDRGSDNSFRLGTTEWVGLQVPDPVAGFPLGQRETSSEQNERLCKKIRAQAVPWDFNQSGCEVETNGRRLCEPTSSRLSNNLSVTYFRDLGGSQRLFAQFASKKAGVSPIVPTPIPDAPSKSVFGRVDKYFLLIGNQVVSKRGTRRDPLTIAVSSDGTSFDNAFAIRWRTSKFRTPKQQDEPDGRGRGFQYPDFVRFDDDLLVIYSVNKESIEVSRIPLESILPTN